MEEASSRLHGHQDRMREEQQAIKDLLPDVLQAIQEGLRDKAFSTRERSIKLYAKLVSDVYKREEALERMAMQRTERFLQHVERSSGETAEEPAGKNPFRVALESEGKI